MDRVTEFGIVAVVLMLVTYALEEISHWFLIAFAAACVLGSIYGFLLVGGWPFGVLEAVWAGLALWRWRRRTRRPPPSSTNSAPSP
jgi:hypothetical protein